MLFEAMHEMALSQGNAIEHPVSLSLFLLEWALMIPL